MDTAHERSEKQALVQGRLDELAAINAESLGRRSELSPSINFDSAVPSFQQMLELFRQLKDRDLSRLTIRQIDAINSSADRLLGYVRSVRDFTLNGANPSGECQTIISQIEGAYDPIMDPLLLPLAFTSTQATDYARIEREAKGYHSTMKAEADRFKTMLESDRVEAKRALDAVRQLASEGGVAANSTVFETQANSHKENAWWWWVSTVVMAVVTLLATLAALWGAISYSPPSDGAAIQFVVAKLIVLSSLTLTLIWCSRNYKSEMHNQILNRHRANALKTFNAFVAGSSDDRVKDAILMHAAQAAFGSRSTGYDNIDNDGQSVNPVVEILGRSISGSRDGASS